MPTYEYSCEKCGTFETVQKMSDAPLLVCPTCQGQVRRLLSAAPFHLKGSGWYKTDYASSSSSGSPSSSTPPSTATPSETPGSTASEKGSDKSAATTTSSESTGGKEKSTKAGGDGSSSPVTS